MKTKIKLSPPWTTYYRQLQALFGKDPDIKLFFDEDESSIKVLVKNAYKANALEHLLPKEVSFGDVVVKILIDNPEEFCADTGWEEAFEGNPVVGHIEVVEVPFSSVPVVYIGFVREVVQFFNDDLSDPHGNCSTLYQEIAKEVFKDQFNVFFYTVDMINISKRFDDTITEIPAHKSSFIK